MKKKPEYLLLFLMILQSGLSLAFPVYTDAGWIKDSWLGNDLVTLLIVCPVFLWSLTGKSPYRVVFNLGSVGYAIYNYCFYMFGARLNILFLLYVALVILGISLLFLKLGFGTAGNELSEKFDRNKSFLLPGIIFCLIGMGLGIVWTGFWMSHILFGNQLPVEEPSFRLVASLDLALVVSSMIISGIGLIKKQKIGFILGSVAGVQGILYLLVLTINSAIISIKSNFLSGELIVWGILVILEAAGLISMLYKLKSN